MMSIARDYGYVNWLNLGTKQDQNMEQEQKVRFYELHYIDIFEAFDSHKRC